VIAAGVPAPRDHRDVSSFIRMEGHEGLPMLGRATKHGKTYLFWLGRIHSSNVALGDPSLASFDEMVAFLQVVGATDVVITDGSDSIGLMLKDRGIIPGLEPGRLKNQFTPTAIGFRKLT
jgi:hypothetical protein